MFILQISFQKVPKKTPTEGTPIQPVFLVRQLALEPTINQPTNLNGSICFGVSTRCFEKSRFLTKEFFTSLHRKYKFYLLEVKNSVIKI